MTVIRVTGTVANVHDSIGMEMIVLLVLITRTMFISSSYSITMTMECKYVIANGLKHPLECNYLTSACLSLVLCSGYHPLPWAITYTYIYIIYVYVCICYTTALRCIWIIYVQGPRTRRSVHTNKFNEQK